MNTKRRVETGEEIHQESSDNLGTDGNSGMLSEAHESLHVVDRGHRSMQQPIRSSLAPSAYLHPAVHMKLPARHIGALSHAFPTEGHFALDSSWCPQIAQDSTPGRIFISWDGGSDCFHILPLLRFQFISTPTVRSGNPVEQLFLSFQDSNPGRISKSSLRGSPVASSRLRYVDSLITSHRAPLDAQLLVVIFFFFSSPQNQKRNPDLPWSRA